MELKVNIKKRLRSFELVADFELKNEVLGILGHSGAGKSMLLKCIAGLERPDDGYISLNGKVLYDSSCGINLSPQQRRIGYLFQSYALFPNMTVEENLSFVMKEKADLKPERIEGLLASFSISSLKDAFPSALSGGQQQRAALARAVAADLELLLLDEPFSALDTYVKEQLESELDRLLFFYGNSAILVSHDVDEAFRLSDKMAVIQDGKLFPVKEKHELISRPETSAEAVNAGFSNISSISIVGDRELIADEFGINITFNNIIPDWCRYIAISSKALELAADTEQECVYTMELIRVVENTSSYFLYFRKSGTLGRAIKAEISKEYIKDISFLENGTEFGLRIPEASIIFLRQ